LSKSGNRPPNTDAPNSVYPDPEILELALNLPLFTGIKNYCGPDAEDAEQGFDWPGDEMEDVPHRAGI
jgi:hypothetical protein